MSLSTQSLNPVSQSSMLYPALNIGKTKPPAKHYRCPRCEGNVRSRLQVEIVRKEEMVFGFICYDCHKRWYVSSRLILNQVFEEQISKIYRFTKVTDKEFGALLVKTPEGIRLDMIDVGEHLSVTFKRTKEYREDEVVIGSIHAHPLSSTFSTWDLLTFLRDSWEKISIVVGSEGTINVAIKTPNTVKIGEDNLSPLLEENKSLTSIEMANKFQFILFAGKVNNLKLLAGVSNMPITSLEKLFRQIE